MPGSAGRPRPRANQEPCNQNFARQRPVRLRRIDGRNDGNRKGNPEALGERRGVAKALAAEYQTASTFPISNEHFFVFLFSQKEGLLLRILGSGTPGQEGARRFYEEFRQVMGRRIAWISDQCGSDLIRTRGLGPGPLFFLLGFQPGEHVGEWAILSSNTDALRRGASSEGKTMVRLIQVPFVKIDSGLLEKIEQLIAEGLASLRSTTGYRL